MGHPRLVPIRFVGLEYNIRSDNLQKSNSCVVLNGTLLHLRQKNIDAIYLCVLAFAGIVSVGGLICVPLLGLPFKAHVLAIKIHYGQGANIAIAEFQGGYSNSPIFSGLSIVVGSVETQNNISVFFYLTATANIRHSRIAVIFGAIRILVLLVIKIVISNLGFV